MNIKKNTLFISLLWTLLIAASCTWNYTQAQKAQEQLALQTARSIFNHIIITRRWNAQHGGVYVPVTKTTIPNPYLEVPMREIQINDSLTLTKINPAFMTRQIAEAARAQAGIQFHITSLHPLRPENKATEQEEVLLKEFEKGVKEAGLFIEHDKKTSFFYMAPLKTEKACLPCHEKQGYKEGDIRGGISVTLPFTQDNSLGSLLLAHIGIALTGLFGIFIAGLRLDRAYSIIQRQAAFDSLTGISNRHRFSELIVTEFERSNRVKGPLSVIMCDIDHFKRYNDTYGHTSGDKCLRQVAQEIKKSLTRPGDFCARYGGEEFVVILPDTSHKGALHVAEKIRLNIIKLQILHEKSPPLSVVSLSLGVATSTDQPLISHEDLLKNADSALYQAKANGRNRLESYSNMENNPKS
ncbi:MAG: diguanylate cyclase [Proteobacteria bacterium]|nr:diguanylate cyclase [Pseudomonadota bacterium]MBU1649075.1 diguanylate cyclase [Pseudomonadota bacterium]MBU1986483.1 diguanylate cyclase [Pseudomonadota bacterium]